MKKNQGAKNISKQLKNNYKQLKTIKNHFKMKDSKNTITMFFKNGKSNEKNFEMIWIQRFSKYHEQGFQTSSQQF